MGVCCCLIRIGDQPPLVYTSTRRGMGEREGLHGKPYLFPKDINMSWLHQAKLIFPVLTYILCFSVQCRWWHRGHRIPHCFHWSIRIFKKPCPAILATVLYYEWSHCLWKVKLFSRFQYFYMMIVSISNNFGPSINFATWKHSIATSFCYYYGIIIIRASHIHTDHIYEKIAIIIIMSVCMTCMTLAKKRYVVHMLVCITWLRTCELDCTQIQ